MRLNWIKKILVIIFLISSFSNSEENILKFGDFRNLEKKEGRIKGWYILPKYQSQIDIKEKNGTKFLRIKNDDPKKAVNMGITILLSDEWSYLIVKTKMRVKNLTVGKEGWHNARIVLRYENEKGNLVSYPKCPYLSQNTELWKEIRFVSKIPEKAKRLTLQPGLYFATGIFDISYIEIHPVKKGENIDAQLPPDEKIYWGKEPVEKITSTREEIVLNGIWKFMPAIGSGFRNPTERGWGYIRVPGAWATERFLNIPGVIAKGIGNIWSKISLSELGRVWYEREMYIPLSWKGSKATLKIDKINTDGIIFINGKRCGEIEWPYGEIDITDYVSYGRKNNLRILVLASNTNISSEKIFQDGYLEKITGLRARGITGNVILKKSPLHFCIDDIFIKTSVRNKTLGVDVSISNPEKFKGSVAIICEIEDYSSGKKVKTFRKEKIYINGENKNNLHLLWKWRNPKLWDYKRPNLYNLYLKVKKGEEIIDEYKERFGFREFRIEGRKFLLNEKVFNLKPTILFQENYGLGGMKEAIEGNLKGLIEANFNSLQPWPWDHYKRGNLHYRELWAEVADEVGLPLLYPALSIKSFYKNWSDEETKRKWEKLMVEEWKRVKNHPSIVMWFCSANMFGHSDDMNPRRIGDSKVLLAGCPKDRLGHYKIMEEAIETIRKYDNTRPITSHESVIGDAHTCNTYLDLTPLQEREEWLSKWAKYGDKPFIAIEFGTPLYFTFLRGRDGAHGALISEPLMTEFCAIYLGKEAYQLETDKYREAIKKNFKGGQEYNWWQGNYNLTLLPSHLKLQSLFIKNTWRSWRTFGWSGGGVPWEWSCWAWLPGPGGIKKMQEFIPGRRWCYMKQQPLSNLLGLQKGGWRITEAGKTLKELNSPTLMYIAGKPEHFTEKSHHFYSRGKCIKQVVLINDEREPQKFVYKIYAEVNGEKIFEKKKKGSIKTGEIKFEPFSFSLPKVKQKVSGKIILEGKIGEKEHKDIFTFSVYPVVKKVNKKVFIFDPKGETSQFLTYLGCKLEKWNSRIEKGKILIIGKNALIGNENLISRIKEFAENGGKVLICAHNPDWLRKTFGFRIARHVSRRVFPVETQIEHPIISGIDSDDLRDWNGKGNLIPEEINTSLEWKSWRNLRYGYHWGNRGSVTSAAIEKPHFGNFIPILECEFDLAYSPLMEIKFGKGVIIFSTLDIEGRERIEPVAEIMIKRLIEYLESYKVSKKLKTFYTGDKKIEKWLNSTGLIYQEIKDINEINEKCLLIVGKNISQKTKEIMNKVLEKGGNILLLLLVLKVL